MKNAKMIVPVALTSVGIGLGIYMYAKKHPNEVCKLTDDVKNMVKDLQ